MKTLLLILLFPMAALSQTKQHVNIYNGDNVLFCGYEEVHLEIKGKSVEFYSAHVNLKLRVIDKKVDKNGTWECEDENDNVYYITPLYGEGNSRGLVFQPALPHLFSILVSNISTCK